MWGQFESLKVVGGILVRELNLLIGTTKRQILIPPPLVKEVLTQCHDVVTAGHVGMTKTLANVRRRFLWCGMRKDVEIHVRRCELCARYKSPGHKRRAGLKDHCAGVTMERVTMDIVGPFPKSKEGNVYVLVCVDCFTKYIEVYSLPNQEAVTIAKVISDHFVPHHGTPYFIHTDQGPNFESQLFAEVCRLLKIEKTRTTPFHPQSDGQSERMIKTLTTMVAQICEEQSDWDSFVQLMAGAYRATPHATTEFSPNFMLYGRELNMPVDLMMGASPEDPSSPVDFVTKLKARLNFAYDLCKQKLGRAAERQRRLYNSRTFGGSYKVLDMVWLMEKRRKKGVTPKLQQKWRGPCLVVRLHSDVVVELQISSKKSTTVHTDLLKPCHSERKPGWMNRFVRKLQKD